MTSPCPQCGEPAGPPADNASHPFCSDRCRLLDLSAWLGERYAIPGKPVPDGASRPDGESDVTDETDDLS